MLKNTWHVDQVVLLVLRVGQPDVGVRLAGSLELHVGRHLRQVRVLAEAGLRVQRQVGRAHVVHARHGMSCDKQARQLRLQGAV